MLITLSRWPTRVRWGRGVCSLTRTVARKLPGISAAIIVVPTWHSVLCSSIYTQQLRTIPIFRSTLAHSGGKDKTLSVTEWGCHQFCTSSKQRKSFCCNNLCSCFDIVNYVWPWATTSLTTAIAKKREIDKLTFTSSFHRGRGDATI